MEKNIKVLSKNNKYLSPTTTKLAKLLIKRKKAIKVNEDTIKLTYDKKELRDLQRQIIEEEGRVCYICGRKIPLTERATVDHVIPKNRYGEDDKKNLHCCCQRCNVDKGSMTLKEYYQYIKLSKLRGKKYKYIDLEKLKKFI